MSRLLAPYTMVIVSTEDAEAPPFVSLETDRAAAELQALAWARETFGEGAYRVTGGQSAGTGRASRWGTIG